MNLLMISGQARTGLANKGAFYAMMSEFHIHWGRVDIIATGSRWGFNKPVEEVYFDNVFVHTPGTPMWLQPLFILLMGRKLFTQFRHERMTVQEYPPFYNGLGAFFLHLSTGLPYMLEVHHIPGYPRAASLKEWIYKWLCRLFLGLDAAGSAVVRVVNQKQAGEFLQNAGIPSGKIKYIPSAYVDPAVFRPEEAVKKYDCIFVGRLVESKGLDLFLEAVRIGGFSALIAGDGPLRGRLHYRIANSKLPVTISGWARDSHEIAGLINQARVLVMPSYNEGGPRVVVEAMACGVPVVASNVGLVPDIIIDGQSGRIAGWQPGDISEKVKSLLNDAGLYAQCRAAGLEIARGFEKSATLENYVREINGMVP